MRELLEDMGTRANLGRTADTTFEGIGRADQRDGERGGAPESRCEGKVTLDRDRERTIRGDETESFTHGRHEGRSGCRPDIAGGVRACETNGYAPACDRNSHGSETMENEVLADKDHLAARPTLANEPLPGGRHVQLQPVVEPQVSHLRQVPLRTSVM